MTTAFRTDGHKRLFDDVLRHLGALGYGGDLLVSSYQFVDWFVPSNPVRTVPAAAFWTTPHSYDSACFAVIVPNGRCGADLVNDHRALGAPIALEVREDAVVEWTVGKDPDRTQQRAEFQPDSIPRVFRERESDWSRLNVLRIKNLGLERGPQQGDLFIDTGLIPALELHISKKLSPILADAIADSRNAYRAATNRDPDPRSLFRLIFRVLASKVLHDRGIRPFSSYSNHDAKDILAAIAKHYGEPAGPIVRQSSTTKVVFDHLWRRVDFRNLSVEALAYIYENTLITPESREALGTHSTPHNLARYIVHRLPFEKLGATAPLVLDPFCGHGVFLVAALQRLREQLVTANLNPLERHRYFVSRLRGFDIDEFAVEVAKLCLILADIPNPNGWNVFPEDVFASPRFLETAGRAGVVLSNPPFGPFSDSERHAYFNLSSVFKPVAFLEAILTTAPEVAMLGMVLPQQVIDGVSYRALRERLAHRFEEIEIVALPDRVFQKSKIESAILIAKTPAARPADVTTVTYTEVADRHREQFLTEFVYTRRSTERKTPEESASALSVPLLAEVWLALKELPTLLDTADVRRGIEWVDAVSRHVSTVQRPGYQLGIQTARGLLAFRRPETAYLDTREADRRRRAFELPWQTPKVIVNAARRSRGQWRIVALPDDSGLWCTQRFHAIWPKPGTYTIRTLAAILNGPIASAFVAMKESARDVTVETMRAIPLPRLGDLDVSAIDDLVAEYMRLDAIVPHEASLLQRQAQSRETSKLQHLLLEIDALVLRAYRLAPRLERMVLDSFVSGERPVGVPFSAYYPLQFTSTIPLWMYISSDYQRATADNFLSSIPSISDPELLRVLEEAE